MRYIKESTSTKKGKFAGKEFDLEYGQFESVEEAQNEAGSVTDFLDWLNAMKKTAAVNAGRAIISNAGEKAVLEGDEGVAAKAAHATKNHKISTRGVGAKQKAEDLDSLVAAFKSGDNIALDAVLAKYNVKV